MDLRVSIYATSIIIAYFPGLFLGSNNIKQNFWDYNYSMYIFFQILHKGNTISINAWQLLAAIFSFKSFYINIYWITALHCAEQWGELAICIHIAPPPWVSLPPPYPIPLGHHRAVTFNKILFNNSYLVSRSTALDYEPQPLSPLLSICHKSET